MHFDGTAKAVAGERLGSDTSTHLGTVEQAP
jgi:hypothetical protein